MSFSSTSSVPKARSQSSQKYEQHCREIKTEIIIKLVFSWVLSVAAIASLFKLVSSHQSQQAKLHELRTQVEETETRVNYLRQKLENNFAPEESKTLMRNYGTQINPNQSLIFWLEQDKNKTPKTNN